MQTSGPLSIFLAVPNMTQALQQTYPAFNNDKARFQVLSLTDKWGDVLNDVTQYRPDVLVLDAGIAPDPNALRDLLAQLPAGTTALAVLPSSPGWPESQGLIEAITTCVRGVYIAPVNWAQVAAAAHTAGVTERTRAFNTAPAGSVHAAQSRGARPGGVVYGTRTIAAMSFAGGPGKSTIMESVAVQLARNHVKTLLFSLNSPAAAVGHLRLSFSPNATEWFNRPTPEGFQAALQKPAGLETLDVLLAPEDPEVLEKADLRQINDATSIRNLILAAYAFNYGAVLLDLPPFADSMWALHALQAANMALLVCRPTVHDQFAAIRAYKLFTERLAPQYRVPLDAIFTVINFKSPDDNLSERDFADAVSEFVGAFPPILATFPFVAKLPAVQNRGESPVLAPETEAFAKVARSLTSKLVGAVALPNGEDEAKRERSLFGIKLKIK